eukprot:TRINITY_DN1520_c0_g1_i1.p1 TRINITY_DN1520_c0_g1~~TRINITY_DN1520_c0_g1_i1.p1  ORF type:complete len:348 (-),score=103.04 TRINITY_DN1520_c0_g1_i1:351-1394(-)
MFQKTTTSLSALSNSISVNCDQFPSLCKQCTQQSEFNQPIFVLFNPKEKSSDLEDSIKQSITFSETHSAKKLVDFVRNNVQSFVTTTTSISTLSNTINNKQKSSNGKKPVVVLVSNKNEPSLMFVGVSRNFRESFHFVFLSSVRVPTQDMNEMKNKFKLPADLKESTFLFVLPDQLYQDISQSVYYKHEKNLEKITQFLKSYELGFSQLLKKREQKKEAQIHTLTQENFDNLCSKESGLFCVISFLNDVNNKKDNERIKLLAEKYKRDDKFKFVISDKTNEIFLKNFSQIQSGFVILQRKNSRFTFLKENVLDVDNCVSLLDKVLGGLSKSQWNFNHSLGFKNPILF